MELDNTRTIESALKRIAQLERRNAELEAEVAELDTIRLQLIEVVIDLRGAIIIAWSWLRGNLPEATKSEIITMLDKASD